MQRQEQVCNISLQIVDYCKKKKKEAFSVFVFSSVGRHDAKDSPAVPHDSNQRVMGGCDEPGPQLDHFLLDILPPSRRWQGCDFPGMQGKSYCHVLLVCIGHLSVFCLLFTRLNLKSSFSRHLSWKKMPKKTHRKAVSHRSFFFFFAFFFLSGCDCSLAYWLLHHINLMWKFSQYAVYLSQTATLSTSELYPLTLYLPNQIKMQIVVSRNGHTNSVWCMLSPHICLSFLH